MIKTNKCLIILLILVAAIQIYFCGIGALVGTLIGSAIAYLLIYLIENND